MVSEYGPPPDRGQRGSAKTPGALSNFSTLTRFIHHSPGKIVSTTAPPVERGAHAHDARTGIPHLRRGRSGWDSTGRGLKHWSPPRFVNKSHRSAPHSAPTADPPGPPGCTNGLTHLGAIGTPPGTTGDQRGPGRHTSDCGGPREKQSGHPLLYDGTVPIYR